MNNRRRTKEKAFDWSKQTFAQILDRDMRNFTCNFKSYSNELIFNNIGAGYLRLS
jgi:hypothetical protein